MKSLIKFCLVAALITGSGYAFAKSNTVVNADTSKLIDSHLSGFSSIKIAGPFEVHLTQGPVESVKFEEPQDVAGRIVTEVIGGVLKIHNKHDNWGTGYKSWYGEKSIWHNHKRIVVYVTAKDLDGIILSGSCAVLFNNVFTAPVLKLRIRGSGQMIGKIEVKRLESRISGSGNMKLSGNAQSSTVRVAGSGKFTARNLVTVNSAAHVSGSGNAEICASDKIVAAVNGSGVVNYTGDAKTIKSSKSGSGEIRRF